jgi:hypothetical protein
VVRDQCWGIVNSEISTADKLLIVDELLMVDDVLINYQLSGNFSIFDKLLFDFSMDDKFSIIDVQLLTR